MKNSVQLQELEVADNSGSENLVAAGKRDRLDRAWLLWAARRRLWVFTYRGLIIAAVIAFLLPKEYQSTTRLMPPDPMASSGMAMMAAMAGKGEGGSAGGAGLGGIAGELLGMHDPGALYANMLQSRTVQDRIVERFDLRKVYHKRYMGDARKKLGNRTEVGVDRKSGAITITVMDNDPNRAAQIAQAYVDELDNLLAVVSTSAARRERIFIEQRLKTVKQDLDQVSQQFSEYSSKTATLDMKDQGVAMVQAAAVLEGQLIAAQSELEGLEQIYTDSNVRVRSLRARIEELRRQVKIVGGDSSGSGTTDSASDLGFPSIRKLPLVGVRWADLYRETKIRETVYELLTEQYELAKIEEAKEIPTVKIYDVAIVPEQKSGPHRLVLMILGAILSLGVGAAWVLGCATWQQIDDGDPRKQLSLEVLSWCSRRWSQWNDRWRTLWRRLSSKSSSNSSAS